MTSSQGRGRSPTRSYSIVARIVARCCRKPLLWWNANRAGRPGGRFPGERTCAVGDKGKKDKDKSQKQKKKKDQADQQKKKDKEPKRP